MSGMQEVRGTHACRARTSGSITAYCPQVRKCAQDRQSASIFSGSQVCGTIENPIWTKYPATCVNAERLSRRPPRARRARPPAPGPTPRDRTSSLTTRKRTSATVRLSGEIDARHHSSARHRDDETRDTWTAISSGGAAKTAFGDVMLDQLMNRLHVLDRRRSNHRLRVVLTSVARGRLAPPTSRSNYLDGRHCVCSLMRAPPWQQPSARHRAGRSRRRCPLPRWSGGSRRTTVSLVRLTSRPR